MIHKNTPSSDAEANVYVTFVDSLFFGTRQLVIGACLQLMLIVFVASSTQEPVFASLSAALIGVTVWRIWQTHRFHAGKAALPSALNEKTIAWYRKQENAFTISTTALGFIIGMVGYYGLIAYSSQYSTIASLTLLFASGQSVIGRLYGSQKLALISLSAAFLPSCVGLLAKGDLLHFSLVVLLLPYALLVVSVLQGVRKSVRHAVLRRHEVTEIANRFDFALNTMSHGLLMVGDDRRIDVANSRASSMLLLPQKLRLTGRTLDSVLRFFRIRAQIKEDQIENLRAMIVSGREGSSSTMKISLPTGQVFEFNMRRADKRSVIVIEDITERVKSLDKIKHLARFDHLTDLPNRNHFSEQVLKWKKKMRLASTASSALIILDIDDFKLINDSVGHVVGDHLLCSVADRLRSFVDQNTFVSRLGGDEFLVYFGDCGPHEVLEERINLLMQTLSGLHELGDRMVKVAVTLGAIRFGANQTDIEHALAKADIALYEAKRLGKARCVFFAEELEKRFERSRLLEIELAEALANDALELHFQPIVNTTTGRVSMCEALCRWHHPTLGNIPPFEFIKIAEEHGHIWDVTSFVLRTACKTCAAWPDEVRVSLNLSVLDFQNPQLMTQIQSALDNSGLDPSRLVIELTETAVMRNKEMLTSMLEQMRAMGIRIALDDFGTGYSSLSYLSSLPVDHVKIDRSFVVGFAENEKKHALLAGVTDLCRTLGLSVTLEGVETYDELELVNGVAKPDQIQGWVFGAAKPAKDITALLGHLFPLSRKEHLQKTG